MHFRKSSERWVRRVSHKCCRVIHVADHTCYNARQKKPCGVKPYQHLWVVAGREGRATLVAKQHLAGTTDSDIKGVVRQVAVVRVQHDHVDRCNTALFKRHIFFLMYKKCNIVCMMKMHTTQVHTNYPLIDNPLKLQ